MYAIIATGGKQYKVSEGDTIYIEKLDAPVDDVVTFPVLMLSARGEEYDKLFGFEVGVDDYVTKPFSPKELMARINVIIKRHAKPQEKTEKDPQTKVCGVICV